jgi:hypothetical protein
MPGKRSNPLSLREQIENNPDYSDYIPIYNRVVKEFRVAKVKRSRDAAQKSADAFKATGEGTMEEARNYVLSQDTNKRNAKKYGGPPRVGGAMVTGTRKNNNPV